MLICKYFGIKDDYCKLQSTTLEKSIFKIRTALGDSVTTYTNTDATPIHGTGQGSCATAAIWLLISSFLMDLLEKISNGMEMEDILDHIKNTRQIIEGFVDDNTLFTNLKYGRTNLNELVKKAEQDWQNWECLLHTSGGALELSKCFYYLLSWKWDKWGSPIPQTIKEQNLPPTKITMSATNEIITLQQKEVQDSHKTLGTYKCIFGSEIEQYTKLLEKATI
jgi:hypothetical protein